MPTNLLGLDSAGLQAYCAGLGERPFRARQLMRWIELPDHNVLIQAIGNRSEASKMAQVRDIITSTIRVP